MIGTAARARENDLRIEAAQSFGKVGNQCRVQGALLCNCDTGFGGFLEHQGALGG